MRHTMQPSMRVTEDGRILRWIVLTDSVLVQAVAAAIGEKGLQELVDHFTAKGEFVAAARCCWASAHDVGYFASGAVAVAALGLIEQSSEEGDDANMLEFDICSTIARTLGRADPEMAERGKLRVNER